MAQKSMVLPPTDVNSTLTTMATSMSELTLGPFGGGFSSAFRVPSRPATTSPSFFLSNRLKELSFKETRPHRISQLTERRPLQSLNSQRAYWSLPSSPPRCHDLSQAGLPANVKEKDTKSPPVPLLMAHSTEKQTSKANKEVCKRDNLAMKNEKESKVYPEWYVELPEDYVDIPCMGHDNTDTCQSPQDLQKELRRTDSSSDDALDVSIDSIAVDLKHLEFRESDSIDPVSVEVSKLNSLGRGQSRFLSLFGVTSTESSSRRSSTSGTESYAEEDAQCDEISPTTGIICKPSGFGSRKPSDRSDLFEDAVETLSSSEDASGTDDEMDEFESTGDINDRYETDIASGIEELQRGLARLISIPGEKVCDPQVIADMHEEAELAAEVDLNFEFNEKESFIQEAPSPSCHSKSGSRLLKLFPSLGSGAPPTPDVSSPWSDSPLMIQSLWSSDSSLNAAGGEVQSITASEKNSPIVTSTLSNNMLLTPTSPKMPNVISISPTAPLHISAPSTCYSQAERFPSSIDFGQNNSSSTSFTACDLSNEEVEFEAAIERGDGFHMNHISPTATKEDLTWGQSSPAFDPSIWSPITVQLPGSSEGLSVDLDSVSPQTFSKIAASNIMEWLDMWVGSFSNAATDETNCDPQHEENVAQSNGNNATSEEFLDGNLESYKPSQTSEDEVSDTSFTLYEMFGGTAKELTLQRLLSLSESDLLHDDVVSARDELLALAQSPGILDFLIEKHDQEEEPQDYDGTGAQGLDTATGLQFLLNSRASNIYDSYLLFPDLVQLSASPSIFKASNHGSPNESDFFTQLFKCSSSSDWMSTLDHFTKAPLNKWEQSTLQSLSPKTPFTPTGNLSENLGMFERRNSVTLEQLCNLTAAATSLATEAAHMPSFSSADFLLQYIQSQLGCFQNLSSLQEELFGGKSNGFANLFDQREDTPLFLNNHLDGCIRMYRPIPILPLQFLNKLSLTDAIHLETDKEHLEDLLRSPKTHFRPITPSAEPLDLESSEDVNPDEDSGELDTSVGFDSPTISKRRSLPEMKTPDDADDELAAIHEGADHSKMVEIYAQMQLQQQIAAEQKQNFPQPVAVEDGDDDEDEEVAYEDKHSSHRNTDSEKSVQNYALDCAAEAAATAAVNVLGSTEPEEAISLLEEWEWKNHIEALKAEDAVTDIGYFKPASSLQNPFCDSHVYGESNFIDDVCGFSSQPCEVMNHSATWSSNDGSVGEESTIDSDMKNIWITGSGSQPFCFPSSETQSLLPYPSHDGRGLLVEAPTLPLYAKCLIPNSTYDVKEKCDHGICIFGDPPEIHTEGMMPATTYIAEDKWNSCSKGMVGFLEQWKKTDSTYGEWNPEHGTHILDWKTGQPSTEVHSSIHGNPPLPYTNSMVTSSTYDAEDLEERYDQAQINQPSSSLEDIYAILHTVVEMNKDKEPTNNNSELPFPKVSSSENTESLGERILMNTKLPQAFNKTKYTTQNVRSMALAGTEEELPGPETQKTDSMQFSTTLYSVPNNSDPMTCSVFDHKLATSVDGAESNQRSSPEEFNEGYPEVEQRIMSKLDMKPERLENQTAECPSIISLTSREQPHLLDLLVRPEQRSQTISESDQMLHTHLIRNIDAWVSDTLLEDCESNNHQVPAEASFLEHEEKDPDLDDKPLDCISLTVPIYCDSDDHHQSFQDDEDDETLKYDANDDRKRPSSFSLREDLQWIQDGETSV